MVADFDPSTGIVSNPVQISTPSCYSYGVEFSLSGEWVYIGGVFEQWWIPSWPIKAKWEDLRNSVASPFTYLYIKVNGVATNFHATNFKRGPDRKLYGVSNNDRTLYVMMDPEAGGNDIIRYTNFFNSGGYPTNGLPNFMSYAFSEPKKYLPFLCTDYGSSYVIEITTVVAADPAVSLEWNFDDGTVETDANVINVGTHDCTKQHMFNAPGTYNVVVTPITQTGKRLSTIKAITVVHNCEVRSDVNIRQQLLNEISMDMNNED